MLFNSNLFLLFLPTVVVLFYLLQPAWRRGLLLVASYSFYWVWSVPFSLLLVASTFVDFFAARTIERSDRQGIRRLALFSSLALNLGSLCLFKYADFLTNASLELFSFRPWPVLDLVLPLGISFYTFQTMSYTIDVFRGHTKACSSWVDVALYVSFFPQLVAGPIVRSDVLIPQLDGVDRGIDLRGIRQGLALIVYGMAKKVLVADSMAPIVNEVYGAPEQFGAVELALATYAFAVQIYCDFSGYSDIAIGSARLLGIRLPENFKSPYLSCGIREFWRRWHISLSTWLRDYLYISLGGNRGSAWKTYRNLLLTMILGGLWHGAGFNWIVWGSIHGVMLSLERRLDLPERSRSVIRNALRWLVTFHLVCLSWVFFRASDVTQAGEILSRIVSGADGELSVRWTPILGIALVFLVGASRLRSRWIELAANRPQLIAWVTVAATIAFALIFRGQKNPEFIYFQF